MLKPALSTFGVIALLFAVGSLAPNAEAPASVLPTAQLSPPPRALYTIAFVGDSMLDRTVRKKVESVGGGDYNFPFAPVVYQLRSYDFLFGNLEGPLSDQGANQGSLYSFRMDPAAAPALASAGFDMLSVANNHMADWGSVAFTDTLARLETAGIVPSGGGTSEAEAYAPRYFTLADGTTLGVVSFSQFIRFFEAGTSTAGIAVIDEPKVTRAVAEATAHSDITIASFHWGDEYEPQPNAYQRRIAELAISSGADIIVGHHPHVAQPLERLGDAWVAWSLGNFVFDQYFSPETMQGRVLEVTIERGAIKDARLLVSKQNKDFQVVEIQ